jgi:hypothetical protein
MLKITVVSHLISRFTAFSLHYLKGLFILRYRKNNGYYYSEAVLTAEGSVLKFCNSNPVHRLNAEQ